MVCISKRWKSFEEELNVLHSKNIKSKTISALKRIK